MRPAAPTSAELAVLRVLWRRETATVRDVHEEIYRDTDTGCPTTLKILQNMLAKKLVTRVADARQHVYAAAVSKRLPLDHRNYQFNPQTLIPLEGFGTIYPTMRLTDDWGALEVEHGGARIRAAAQLATVSAVGADASGIAGEGWRLKLNSGWVVRPGKRPGDLMVVQGEDAAR